MYIFAPKNNRMNVSYFCTVCRRYIARAVHSATIDNLHCIDINFDNKRNIKSGRPLVCLPDTTTTQVFNFLWELNTYLLNFKK